MWSKCIARPSQTGCHIFFTFQSSFFHENSPTPSLDVVGKGDEGGDHSGRVGRALGLGEEGGEDECQHDEGEAAELHHGEGHEDVCKLIVDSMVDSDIASVKDKLHLDQYLTMAEEKGHKEIVRYLNDMKLLLSW